MVKTHVHQNIGTCSKSVTIEYDDKTREILNIKFIGGCPGNIQGVSKLCVGRKLDEVYEMLYGIKCGMRGTSCPNELAKGIKEVIEEL